MFRFKINGKNPPEHKAQLVPVLQGTVPIENAWSYSSSLPEGEGIPESTYFKDVHHVFDKYIGIWIGAFNNKDYEFEILKLGAQEDAYIPGKYDELLIRYKITGNSGNVLANTLNLPDDSDD